MAKLAQAVSIGRDFHYVHARLEIEMEQMPIGDPLINNNQLLDRRAGGVPFRDFHVRAVGTR